MQTIVFDVETGPLAESELSALLPPFDPAEVKTGNMKDPEKVAAKIAEAEASQRRDFFDKAALDPLPGRVVAIGMLVFDELRQAGPEGGQCVIIGHDDEARTLREFWQYTQAEMGRMNPMIGFNIFGFDLPFLFRRSWKRRVPIPFGLRRGRYWGDQIIDLRDTWQLGDRQARGSLDSIAGICNDKRNVAGLMPHPERASEPILGCADGRLVLESMIHALTGKAAARAP